jgi:N-formylglutamate amidohydrolase
MDGDLACAIFELRQPTTAARVPLILASPHSGTDYPTEFVAASRLDPLALRRSEDSFVDELFAAAPQLGAPLLAARFPRAYLDANREPYELDPSMFADRLPAFVNTGSPRVRMGLGTIPRIVASGEEIYADKLDFAEAQRRVEGLYRPYHCTLRRLVETTAAQFGGCLLVDCHSMPSAPRAAFAADGAEIVLGDCYGTACAPQILYAARRFFAARGFSVAINAPYAGGFTTEHYGAPRQGRHALQIEISRALYMDEHSFRRKSGFAALADHLAELVRYIGAVVETYLDKSGATTPAKVPAARSRLIDRRAVLT